MQSGPGGTWQKSHSLPVSTGIVGTYSNVVDSTLDASCLTNVLHPEILALLHEEHSSSIFCQSQPCLILLNTSPMGNALPVAPLPFLVLLPPLPLSLHWLCICFSSLVFVISSPFHLFRMMINSERVNDEMTRGILDTHTLMQGRLGKAE